MYHHLQVLDALNHTGEFSSEEMSFLQRCTKLTGLPSLYRCVTVTILEMRAGYGEETRILSHTNAQCFSCSLSLALSLSRTYTRTHLHSMPNARHFWGKFENVINEKMLTQDDKF